MAVSLARLAIAIRYQLSAGGPAPRWFWGEQGSGEGAGVLFRRQDFLSSLLFSPLLRRTLATHLHPLPSAPPAVVVVELGWYVRPPPIRRSAGVPSSGPWPLLT